MLFKETLFKIISLTLVGIGFTAAVAGADKTGAQNTVRALEEMFSQIQHVQEVNQINTFSASQAFVVPSNSTEPRSLLTQTGTPITFTQSK